MNTSGIITVSSGAKLIIEEHFTNGRGKNITANLNVHGTDTNGNASSVSASKFFNGNIGSNTTISGGARINVARNTHNSGKMIIKGRSDNGSPSLLSTDEFDNYDGTTIISNGAQAKIYFKTRNASNQDTNGSLQIIGKNSDGTYAKLSTGSFFNGSSYVNEYHQPGSLTLASGGQLDTNALFFHDPKSQLNFTLSKDYLNTQNHWAITGNTDLDSPSENGVDLARIYGHLNIVFDAGDGILLDMGDGLQDNQTYNLMQIAGDSDNLQGTFKNLEEGDSLGIFAKHEVFISYLGGDGNDITLYTTTALTNLIQGDTNFDQQVNQTDLDFVTQNLGSNNPQGDANHDGTTNLKDLFAVRNNFNPNPNSIPEPTTLLTILTLAPLTQTRRKNR